jgi:glycosyltransferase involved in cell wall biosynthesis
MTLLEAMRAGRAVVSTRIGGTPEAVADGETGVLVPVGDSAALGRALATLLADPARCRALGDAGRRRWVERFTAARMVADTEALYRADLGARGAAGRAA